MSRYIGVEGEASQPAVSRPGSGGLVGVDDRVLDDVGDVLVHEVIGHGPTGALGLDEAGPPQDREVLRDPRLWGVERGHELVHGAVASG
jgi:hypothetical protein